MDENLMELFGVKFDKDDTYFAQSLREAAKNVIELRERLRKNNLHFGNDNKATKD